MDTRPLFFRGCGLGTRPGDEAASDEHLVLRTHSHVFLLILLCRANGTMVDMSIGMCVIATSLQMSSLLKGIIIMGISIMATCIHIRCFIALPILPYSPEWVGPHNRELNVPLLLAIMGTRPQPIKWAYLVPRLDLIYLFQ